MRFVEVLTRYIEQHKYLVTSRQRNLVNIHRTPPCFTMKPLLTNIESDTDITPLPTPKRKTVLISGANPPAPFSLSSFSGLVRFPDHNKPFWHITWATRPQCEGDPMRGPCGIHVRLMDMPFVQCWPPALRLLDDLNNCYVRSWGGDVLVAGAWMRDSL